jgi:hypothetical protein
MFSVGTTFHADPFQSSPRVRVGLRIVAWYEPTAMTKDGDTAATAASPDGPVPTAGAGT